jgi:hypothetical protein
MARYQVTQDCYGFQGRYWDKGEIVDIDPKENPPKYFKLLNGAKPEPTREKKQPGVMDRKTLVAEAKKRGVKSPQTISTERLEQIVAELPPQT